MTKSAPKETKNLGRGLYTSPKHIQKKEGTKIVPKNSPKITRVGYLWELISKLVWLELSIHKPKKKIVEGKSSNEF
jgi:ethanolamine utilization cobalamin adenosyltransferase